MILSRIHYFLIRIRFSLILIGVLLILYCIPIYAIPVVSFSILKSLIQLNIVLFPFHNFVDTWDWISPALAAILINLLISAGVLILFYRSKKIGYSILFGLLAVPFLMPLFAYLVSYEGTAYIEEAFLVVLINNLLTGGTIMVVEFFKNNPQHNRVIKPRKVADPILFSSLGLILVLVIFVSAAYQSAQGEDEIFIVPEGYAGYIVIIYDQEHGEPIRYAGKKRVYAIPPDGILRTQFSGNYGWADFSEFYYDSIAPENRIPFVSGPNSIPKDGSVVACGGSTGNYNKDPQGGGETVEFTRYYVGTSEQISKAARRISTVPRG